MSWLNAAILLICVIASVVSVASARRASAKFLTSNYVRRLSACETDLLTLFDTVESMQKLIKRRTARENMAKARAKKADNGELSDEEWLKQTNRALGLSTLRGKDNGV